MPDNTNASLSLGTAEEIPVGDIKLFDHYLPELDAGNWFIESSQTLEKDGKNLNDVALSAVQEFIVSAPQFALDPAEVLSKFPPEGSTGKYGEILPNIVLKEPLLPWERKIANAAERAPWLALLVFDENELLVFQQGEAPANDLSPTRLINTTVKDFLTADPAGKILKPSLVKAGDVDGKSPCTYILTPKPTFQEIAPRLSELRYLAHSRQVNTGDKAVSGLNEHGLFSVVVANRFPASPAVGSTAPVKNIVHLVSVEGMEKYLAGNADFGAFESVALISLASWSFYTLPDQPEDFKGLLNGIIYPPESRKNSPPDPPHPPEYFRLRLPAPEISESDPAQAEISKRMRDGFVPLEYHTRVGEETFAWYRGPLTPLVTLPLEKNKPFLTADSAIIYHSQFGVFDLSLAAAWNIGRATALADKSFGQNLLEYRRKSHSLADRLFHRLSSAGFNQNDSGFLDETSTAQDEFLKLLDTPLLADIGKPLDANLTDDRIFTADLHSPESSPKMALQNFLSGAPVQEKIFDSVKDDLAPVLKWLAGLLLLNPVPFDYLVPDERMLPVESLRFFYLDKNWLKALLDGALSIGLTSSRDTLLHEQTSETIHNEAFAAAREYRNQLTNGASPDVEIGNENYLMSGLLLRSALVSGWSNLSLRPYVKDSAGNYRLGKILRMEQLSPNVLLCIFDGVPDYLEISEPSESFAFGLNDDGEIALRNTVAPKSSGDAALGSKLSGNPMFKIRDLTSREKLFMRSPASRVLNISSETGDGLIEKLKVVLGNAESISPSDFAVQMIKSPGSVRFGSR